MLIVSWNVKYKPAPSNANFQCVLQLNATSGCGSGPRGLREETVLKCVEMHSILNYNKKYWYIEHIRSVRIPRGDLCKACMLLNMLPGIQQRTECVFFFSLQSFWCEEPFPCTSFAGFARCTRLLCSSSSLLATIKRIIFKTNGITQSAQVQRQSKHHLLPREIKAQTFSHCSS